MSQPVKTCQTNLVNLSDILTVVRFWVENGRIVLRCNRLGFYLSGKRNEIELVVTTADNRHGGSCAIVELIHSVV
jgi:hypothetical protein